MKFVVPAIVLLPSMALAHPGDHRSVGIWHLLTEPDHLAMIAVVAAGVVYVGYRLWSRS